MKRSVPTNVAVLPRTRASSRRVVLNLLGVALFVALMTVGARVSMPGSPVPVTMQSLFVPLAGLMLGARLGAASMVAYIALGLCGAPVFAKAPFGGPFYVAHASFGYLLSFPGAAWVAGRIGRTKRLAVWRVFAANLAAHVVIFAVGVSWLAGWFAVTGKAAWTAAVAMGFIPFLPGAVCKIAVGIAAASAGWLPARVLWPVIVNTNEESKNGSTES